jgi:hypothetical protein
MVDADTLAVHPFVGWPGVNQISHSGQSQIEYAFQVPFVAHLVRDEPQDEVAWKRFGIRWVADPWPELTTEYTTWYPVMKGDAGFLQGAVIPMEAEGPLPALTLLTDTGLSVPLTTILNPAAGVKTGVPFSLAAPVVCHYVQIKPSTACRIWTDEIQWVVQPTPEIASNWITQFTSHGLQGYQSIPRMEVAYASSAPCTLTLTAYDGTSPAPVPLPATGGVFQKALVNLTPNKFLLVQYGLVSSAPFQVMASDWTIWVAGWGRPGLMTVFRNLGSIEGGSATI